MKIQEILAVLKTDALDILFNYSAEPRNWDPIAQKLESHYGIRETRIFRGSNGEAELELSYPGDTMSTLVEGRLEGRLVPPAYGIEHYQRRDFIKELVTSLIKVLPKWFYSDSDIMMEPILHNLDLDLDDPQVWKDAIFQIQEAKAFFVRNHWICPLDSLNPTSDCELVINHNYAKVLTTSGIAAVGVEDFWKCSHGLALVRGYSDSYLYGKEEADSSLGLLELSKFNYKYQVYLKALTLFENEMPDFDSVSPLSFYDSCLQKMEVDPKFFDYLEDNSNVKPVCRCSTTILMRSGCQCGMLLELESCSAAGRNSDGDCFDPRCPQLRDGEPEKTGRHCPLDTKDDELC